MNNRCIFCGVEGAALLSEEDVIPRWLLHHLKTPSHDKRVHAVVSANSGDILKQQVTSSFRFVEPRVCERNCNNGWMSRLESAAREHLMPLVDGTKELGYVRWSEAPIIAKWAVKTAYVHSWAIPLNQPAPQEHLSAICGDDGQVPAGVGVFGMQAPFEKPTGYLQHGLWPHAGYNDLPTGTPPRDSYKIGLQFGQLNLVIAYWPNPEATFILTKRHVRIWPLRRQPDQWWEGFEHPPNSHPLSALVRDLALLHPS